MKLVLTPKAVVHKNIKDWRETWRGHIRAGLEAAAATCQASYFKYTNKASGMRIRSTRISKMLNVNVQEIKGTPRRGDEYWMHATLESTYGGKSWSSKLKNIAYSLEYGPPGGVLKPKRAQLLTIPNRRAGVSPWTRARSFKNGRWINIRGDAFLIKTKPSSKQRGARKPTENVRARKGRKQRSQNPEILYLGKKEVHREPKWFFRDSMTEAATKIQTDFGNKLRILGLREK